jgi:outer membrane receptor for ferrienterochelin and colicin
LEITYKPNDEFSAVAGFRIDDHNFYGTFYTPRLHLRYSLTDDLVFRMAAGKGYRTTNIFSEYASNLVSARRINIVQSNNYGYGLEQESAWNFGFNATYYFIYNYSDATFSFDLYRTQFNTVTIADLDSDPQALSLYSVKNGIFSNSLQAELNFEPVNSLQTRIAYRYLDVMQKNGFTSLEKPLTSKHRALLNLSYSSAIEDFVISRLNYDLTIQWFSKKRIPNTLSNPERYRLRTYSPSFALVNTQITGSFSSLFEIYFGIENLFDFRQNDPIISADNVSSKYFDASLIWAPINGRMIYTGLRYKM